jgi:hypothetical protein
MSEEPSRLRSEIGDARRVVVRDGVILTREDVLLLQEFLIILEGSVSQGKSKLARALARVIRRYGIKAKCCPEPVDEEALAEFMRFQTPPPEFSVQDAVSKLREAQIILAGLITNQPGEDGLVRTLDDLIDKLYVTSSIQGISLKTSMSIIHDIIAAMDSAAASLPLTSDRPIVSERHKFEEGRRAADVRLQNSMMERRTAIVAEAAQYCREGVPIIDRGPFGDTTFMTSTFRAYGVSTQHENSYIISFLRRYLAIDFPRKAFLILRMDAPVSVTHARYLERERETPGNKYTPEYLQNIEDAHDACAAAWGPYVVYDNSNVPYIRSCSPVDVDDGSPMSGTPDEKAVICVLKELCELAREIRAKKVATASPSPTSPSVSDQK